MKKKPRKKTTHYLLMLPQSVECFFYAHRIQVDPKSVSNVFVSLLFLLKKWFATSNMHHFNRNLVFCLMVSNSFFQHALPMSLINCVAKIFAAQKMQWVFFCHYTIFSCAIVYVAFLTSNAMHKIMQSKRNVRLTIDSFIFAINLKLEQFDKTFSCCVLYVVYKYILNRK